MDMSANCRGVRVHVSDAIVEKLQPSLYLPFFVPLRVLRVFVVRIYVICKSW
jgi:hypothetical protein